MTAAYPPQLRRYWRSTFAAWTWGLSTAALALAGGILVYATLGELGIVARVMLPTPPEVLRDLVVTNVRDQLGRRASFRILLFTDEFRWRLNSFDSLDAEPSQPQFTPEMKAVLNNAREVICVGASSEEVPAGVSYQAGRVAEEWRAGRRAEKIAWWVRQALSRPVPVRKLNVGHHAPTGKSRDTSDQRRVVIILVLDRDENANLDEALRAAMSRERARAPIFETLLTRYSLATGQSFTWVP